MPFYCAKIRKKKPNPLQVAGMLMRSGEVIVEKSVGWLAVDPG